MRRVSLAALLAVTILSGCGSSRSGAPTPKKPQEDRWGPSLAHDWDQEERRKAETERQQLNDAAAAERLEQARKARGREDAKRKEEQRARLVREEAERKIAEERARIAKEELEARQAEEQHRREIEDARVTWEELARVFVEDATSTPNSNDELWRGNYKGKWIKWTGTIQIAEDAGLMGGGLVLGLKMSAATMTYDVVVHLEESCRASVAKLKNGQTATVIGTLDRRGPFLHLAEGRIVEIR